MTLVWMVPVTGAAAVLFALWLAYDVLRRDTGTAAMQEIAGMIFEGAMAFLSTAVPDDRAFSRSSRPSRSRSSSAPSPTASSRSSSRTARSSFATDVVDRALARRAC